MDYGKVKNKDTEDRKELRNCVYIAVQTEGQMTRHRLLFDNYRTYLTLPCPHPSFSLPFNISLLSFSLLLYLSLSFFLYLPPPPLLISYSVSLSVYHFLCPSGYLVTVYQPVRFSLFHPLFGLSPPPLSLSLCLSLCVLVERRRRSKQPYKTSGYLPLTQCPFLMSRENMSGPESSCH